MDGDESQGRADGQPDGQTDSRAGGQPPTWRAVAGRRPEAGGLKTLSYINIIYSNLILLQAKLYPNWEFPTGFKPGVQTIRRRRRTTTTATTTKHT